MLAKFTPTLLIKLGTPTSYAGPACEALKASCALFGIDTAESVASFLGQCAVESSRFTRTKENLSYSTLAILVRTFSRVKALPDAEQLRYLRNPEGLANLVYSGKFGNGDVASGDGWRYRGRGYIQTTFKANYEKAASLTGRPYVEQPELLEHPSDAALSAAAYFADKGCVSVANKGLTAETITLITSKVNTKLLELELRAKLTLVAYTELTKELS